jgi:DNA-binding transcriptional LysR family regulator
VSYAGYLLEGVGPRFRDLTVLVGLLPDWRADHATLTLLIPSRRGTLPSVRAFVEFLIRELPPAMS